jgi:hypothetical protein
MEQSAPFGMHLSASSGHALVILELPPIHRKINTL